MLDELKSGHRVVGIKQLRRALSAGKARKVFVAEDADPALIAPVLELCREGHVEVVSVPTMRQLGDACEIPVAAAAAAIV